MKIIGKRSFAYWARYPFLIYAVTFILSSLWVGSLMLYYLLTRDVNSHISEATVTYNNATHALVQFHYPFSGMVLAARNSTEGIVLALLGICSVSFILVYAFRIVNKLSTDRIFTRSVIADFKILSYGLIIFGLVILVTDILLEKNQSDFIPSLFYILIGLILSFIKEIFVHGKQLQEQTDLTI